jgi:hypothetical protein
MEDGSGKECNHQCTGHKDKDFKAQTRNYSHQHVAAIKPTTAIFMLDSNDNAVPSSQSSKMDDNWHKRHVNRWWN